MLVAAERNDRRVWADHRARLELGALPMTTAPVVAQVSRSPRQVQLRRLLRGCDIVDFAPEQAHQVGSLLGQAGTADIVDAHVAFIAGESASTVITTDPDDLRRLAEHLPASIQVKRL
ncbi:MAG: twitching motility protein PilT [Acidimicrobiales bacterium]